MRVRAEKAKSYHKEDLRRDLLAAGRTLIEEKGYRDLSLRALAQQVGVSTAAPYHHFADRRALLLAIAIDGFKDMMGRASNLSVKVEAPKEKLISFGISFVDFARRQPHLLTLMYESELTTPTLDTALQEYQQMGQKYLVSALEAALPDWPPVEINMRVMGLWSAMYGYAALRKKGMLSRFDPQDVPQVDIDRSVVEQAVCAALAPRMANFLG